jgi:membrane associated rhomboid family serine protease
LGYSPSAVPDDLSSRNPELSNELRKELALVEIEHETELREAQFDADVPPGRISRCWGWGGFPLEYNVPPVERRAWGTWTLLVLMVLCSFGTAFVVPNTTELFAFVPENPWRYGGATFLTSTLLHAHAGELIINLYFLYIFGDNVEDKLGTLLFLILFISSAVAGELLHAVLDPRSHMPMAASSGGISGILAVYVLIFPIARLQCYLGRTGRWYAIPALGFLAMWVV